MAEHEIIKINDFQIVLNKNRKSKTTMVEAYISNGFIHENKQNAGITHLLEHIITESWKKCGTKGCTNYWKKKGVLTNASTGQTNTQYYMHGLSEYTDEMVDYITSICTFPIITASRTRKEKKAVHNELLMHQTYPANPLYNLMNSMLFRQEGLIVQDDTKLQIKNLKNITVEHLKKWFHKFYGAGNIVFVISGDFSKSSIMSILKRRLSKAPAIRIIPKYNDIFTVGNDVKFLKNDSIDNTTIMFTFHSQLYQKDMEIFYIDFFKEFIGSGITSLIMEELREKKQLIYNVGLDNYTTPYGTYISIEISCKNKDIEEVVKGALKILKKLATGKFKTEYLNYVKQAYMVEHYETCLNNNYLSGFFGEQYINQIYNFEQKPVILSFDKVAQSILALTKINFVLFIKKLLIFSNMKLAYQGKREVRNLPQLVLRRI